MTLTLNPIAEDTEIYRNTFKNHKKGKISIAIESLEEPWRKCSLLCGSEKLMVDEAEIRQNSRIFSPYYLK